MTGEPEIKTLIQNRTIKVRLLLVNCLGLVILGLWRPAAASARFGWVVMMCSVVLGCLIGIASLMPGSCYLQLSPGGLVVCSCWRRTRYRWSDFEKIGVMCPGPNRMVGVILSPTAPDKNSLPAYKQHNLARYGYEFALPSRYEGTSVEQLVSMLNEWRVRSGDKGA